MSRPMTKQEWLSYIEQTWNAAQKEAWSEQPRTWVGLTDDQVSAIADQHPVEGFDPSIMAFARAIEAKLREKNT